MFPRRLPDFGPLDIRDYEEFKKASRVKFNERWHQAQRRGAMKADSPVDYEKLQLLGMGAFGYVVLARHKPSRNLYALKCLDKEMLVSNNHVDNIRTEMMMLRCIDFPFTHYMVSSCMDANYIYFVLPLIEGGDLYEHLHDIGAGNEDYARFYASQVILALEYLHYLDFIYRDLKPENILVDHTGYLKLADFGFAKRLKRRLRTYTFCGTPEYLAPEIVLKKGHGKSVDWWAAGCFFYELVAGHTPFVAPDAMKTYENIINKNYKFPSNFSQELKDLVGKLLQSDLSKRYGNLKNGVDDIKKHVWLSPIKWLAILNRTVESPAKPRVRPFTVHGKLRLSKEGRHARYSNEFADF